ncbi:MAG: class II fumarate hydratase [Asgard group archaeon]|nr:class II fumarate hydratase [Asgard group archaeon]
MSKKMRIETDLLGELKVPANVYWGINTQRALMNFQISGKRFPEIFLLSLAKVKKACLLANKKLKTIDDDKAQVIEKVIDEIVNERKLLDQFPLDVYQSGSGTQINMNMNEVIANRSNDLLGYPLGKKSPIHPNDHINRSQSSNDVIPTTMHLAAIDLLHTKLLPILQFLKKHLTSKIKQFNDIVKIGRTHLQDAVPISLATEFEVYKEQIKIAEKRLNDTISELLVIPIGGTVLGTGLNTPKNFDKETVSELTKITGYGFKINPVKAEGISSHNTIVNTSAVLRSLALSLLKMANDIRWMGSGPRAGLGELKLPQNEPGSSIMPGKINPTQSEALIQVCLQVIGYDTSIAYAEGYSSILDLNVAKPIMIVNLLESIEILSNGISSFVNNCLINIEANKENIQSNLDRTLMLVTKLTPILGYDATGKIAKLAFEKNKSIKEIILEEGYDIKGNIDEILDPHSMV